LIAPIRKNSGKTCCPFPLNGVPTELMHACIYGNGKTKSKVASVSVK
jgi:hypothetical protein